MNDLKTIMEILGGKYRKGSGPIDIGRPIV